MATSRAQSPLPPITPDLRKILAKQQVDVRDLKPICADNIFQKILKDMDTFESTATTLRITSERAKRIENKYEEEDERKVQLLKSWKRSHGTDATYLALVEAFLREDDRQTAESIIVSVKHLVHAPARAPSPRIRTPPRDKKSGLDQLLLKKQISEVVLKKKCKPKLCLYLSKHIKFHEAVAPFFGFSDEETVAITRNKPNEMLKRQAILNEWRMRNGQAATYHSLATVFYEMDNREVVEKVIDYACQEADNDVIKLRVYPERVRSDWSELDERQRQEIKEQLVSEYESICDAFFEAVDDIKKSFIKCSKTKPVHVKALLTSYIKKHLPALAAQKLTSDLEEANEMFVIFYFIERKTSCLNYRLLEHIVSELKNEESKAALQEYQTTYLNQYLRRSLLEIPCDAFASQLSPSPYYQVGLKLHDDEILPNGADAKMIECRLADLLQTPLITLAGFSDGCIETLLFSIPKAVYDSASLGTPLRQYVQWEEASQLYIITADITTILLSHTKSVEGESIFLRRLMQCRQSKIKQLLDSQLSMEKDLNIERAKTQQLEKERNEDHVPVNGHSEQVDSDKPQHHTSDLNEQITALHKEIEQYKNDIETITEEKESLNKKLMQDKESMIQKMAQERKGYEEEFQREKESLNKQIEDKAAIQKQMQQEQQQYEERISELQKERELLNKQIEKVTQESTQEKQRYDQNISELQKERELLNKQIEKVMQELTQEKQQYDQNISEFQKERELLNEQIDKVKQESTQEKQRYEENISELEKEKESLIQDKDSVIQDMVQKQQQYDKKICTLEKEKESLIQQTQVVESSIQYFLMHNQQQHEKEKESLKKQMETAAIEDEEKTKQYEERIEQYKEKIEQYEEKINKIEKEKESLDNATVHLIEPMIMEQKQNEEKIGLLEQENDALRATLQEKEAQFLQNAVTTSRAQSWSISHTQLEVTGEELGRGSYYLVNVGWHNELKVAVKELHQVIMSDVTNKARMIRMLDILSNLHHPNIVAFYAAVLDHPDDHPRLVTELMDMSLYHAYENKLLTSVEEKLAIMRDVAVGLNYLHCLPDPIIHRNVSSENVLLEAKGPGLWKAKISGFGSSKLANQASTPNPGAHMYSAPEARTRMASKQSTKMDVYSFGILLYEVLIEKRVFQGELESTSFYQLINRCTAPAPEDRPTMKSVITRLNHLMLTECKS